MRKLSSLLIVIFAAFVAFGQNPKLVPQNYSPQIAKKKAYEEPTPSASTSTQGTGIPTGTILSDAVTAIKIGEASNVYTALADEPQQVSVEPGVGTNGGTIAWIHRHNISTSACGGVDPDDNGRFRYSISLDGGLTWNVGSAGTSTVNNAPATGCYGIGTLNPFYSRAGRFPSIVIDDPYLGGGSDDLVLAYCGPALISGAGFSGETVRGSGVNVGNDLAPFNVTSENYFNGYSFPLSITERLPGEYWYIATELSGTTPTGAVSIFKGLWDSTTNTVNWSVAASVNPPFLANVDPTTSTASFGSTALTMGFSSDGKVGYAAGYGYLDGGIDTTVQVWWSETRNGGNTWSTPERFPLEDFPDVTDSISYFFIDTVTIANPGLGLAVGDTVSAFAQPGVQFGPIDMVVDYQGNPHVIVDVFNAAVHQGDGTYAIRNTSGSSKAGFIFNTPENIYVDMTKDTAGEFRLLYLDTQTNFFGAFSEDPNDPNAELNVTTSAQVTRSQDGELVFFHWTETDTSISFANEAPDMKGVALDVRNQTMTPIKNWTNDDANFTGAALLPKCAQQAINTDTCAYTIPTVISDLDDGFTLTPVNHWYFTDVIYNRCSEFTEQPRYFFNCATSPITVNVTETQPDCGTGNGILLASATGGQGNFKYLWNVSGTLVDSAQVSSLTAGVYSVVATDQRGCSEEREVILNNVNAPAISIDSVSDISCSGAGDGSATLDITGGTPGYTFAWGNGETSQTATSLPAGETQVTVTDNNSCQSFSSVTIFEPDPIQSVTSATDASCNGLTDGSVSVTAGGGTGALTYDWSGGIGTDTEIDSIGAGQYIVIITDENNCIQLDTATVEEPNALEAGLTLGFNTRPEAPFDGSLSVEPSNGREPYTYVWLRLDSIAISGMDTTKFFTDTVAVQSGVNIGQISQQIACEYRVEISDANGCEVTAEGSIISFQDGAECQALRPTSVDQQIFDGKVKLYPNPSNGNFTINIDAAQASTYQVEVFSLEGRLIGAYTSENTASFSHSFNMSREGSGVYMVKIISDKGVFTDKIVIMK